MPRTKPVVRAIKLLSLIEKSPSGLRVKDIADQLHTNLRAVYRDLQVLEELPVQLYPDKQGRESFWKIDPDYRNKLLRGCFFSVEVETRKKASQFLSPALSLSSGAQRDFADARVQQKQRDTGRVALTVRVIMAILMAIIPREEKYEVR